MSELQFDPGAQQLNTEGILMAKQTEPDFEGAFEAFSAAQDRLVQLDDSIDLSVQAARILCDDGFASVRQAVYLRGQSGGLLGSESLKHHRIGEQTIADSQSATLAILLTDGILPVNDKRWQSVLTHHVATTKVQYQAIRARQRAEGKLRWGLKGHADQAAIDEGRMLGRAGAYGLLEHTDDGYLRVNTCFEGVEGERANGRPAHAAVWLGRGLMQLEWTRRHDPANVQRALRTAGRLSTQALTRYSSLKALDNHSTL